MALSGTYYLNGPDLASSTAIFADDEMNVCAPNGLYSNGIIVRELLNCVLLPAQPCPQCALPCGNVAGESQDINGTFLGQISGGPNTGAVVIYSIVGNLIPDGVLVTYNGQTYNQLTYIGNVGGPVGLNTPLGQPTYYGSNNNTPVSTTSLPIYTIQTDGSYILSGNSQPITVTANQLDLRGGGTRVYTQVIPKNSTSVSVLNVDFYAPILGTFFSFQTDCPIQLDSFLGSGIQADDTCAAATINYYFAQNATTTATFPITFTPETLATPGIGNYVFLDDGGGTAINNTATSQFVILADSTYIEIQYGIVIATGTCTPAGPPSGCSCSQPVINPNILNGNYKLEIDTGSTAADVGAIVLYFDAAGGPQGILFTFQGVTYNTLSAPQNGIITAPAGQPVYMTSIAGDSFCGIVSNSPYNSAPDNDLYVYDCATTSWVPDGSNNYTVANNQLNTFTTNPGRAAIVIPKPTASGNNTLTVEIFSPCGSVWALDMGHPASCPNALSSRQASFNQGSSLVCGNSEQSIYYNYSYNSRGFPANAPSAPEPELYNFVFSDENGQTPLAAGNYTVFASAFNGSGQSIITVDSNGVITATVGCASCTNEIFISSIQSICSTFCDGTNRTITSQRETLACDSYLTVAAGDVILGGILAPGFYAYAATSTDTQTGPFRIMQIVSSGGQNEVASILECSGGTCSVI